MTLTRAIQIPQLFQQSSQAIMNLILPENSIQNLYKHGCWCAKLNFENENNEILGGNSPVDELDGICKNWFSARACNDRHLGGSCYEFEASADLELEYSVDMNWDKDMRYESLTCSKQGNSCSKDSCLIDQHFTEKILEYFRINNDFRPNLLPECHAKAPRVNQDQTNQEHEIEMPAAPMSVSGFRVGKPSVSERPIITTPRPFITSTKQKLELPKFSARSFENKRTGQSKIGEKILNFGSLIEARRSKPKPNFAMHVDKPSATAIPDEKVLICQGTSPNLSLKRIKVSEFKSKSAKNVIKFYESLKNSREKSESNLEIVFTDQNHPKLPFIEISTAADIIKNGVDTTIFLNSNVESFTVKIITNNVLASLGWSDAEKITRARGLGYTGTSISLFGQNGKVRHKGKKVPNSGSANVVSGFLPIFGETEDIITIKNIDGKFIWEVVHENGETSRTELVNFFISQNPFPGISLASRDGEAAVVRVVDVKMKETTEIKGLVQSDQKDILRVELFLFTRLC